MFGRDPVVAVGQITRREVSADLESVVYFEGWQGHHFRISLAAMMMLWALILRARLDQINDYPNNI